VPFTLSHAAAALPFRRARLVTSALLIGTFAPDLEYFIRLQPGGGWGHTLTGAFALDLPLGLVMLWILHRFVKVPLAYLLPESVRARLTDELAPFAFLPPLRFLLVVLSMLIGIATHFVWDGATHEQYWLVQHVDWLHRLYHLPTLGWWRGCEILQIVSSIAGLLILVVWCLRWYRRTQPDSRIPANPFTPRHRHVIVAIGLTTATAVALLRASVGVGRPRIPSELEGFIDQVVVTFGTLVWWQLAIWGLLGPFHRAHRLASEEETYMQSRASVER
jgi:Domain of unknown function (DUF4184)